jgi:hypothetical protein
MNTYRNRRPGNPWHGVKPASTVTADEAEATRMAAQIAELCERQVWERFMLYRMAETSMETLRKFHAELTAAAIAAQRRPGRPYKTAPKAEGEKP